MTNSMHCCGHVLRKQDCHVLKSTLEVEVEGQGREELSKCVCSVINTTDTLALDLGIWGERSKE